MSKIFRIPNVLPIYIYHSQIRPEPRGDGPERRGLKIADRSAEQGLNCLLVQGPAGSLRSEGHEEDQRQRGGDERDKCAPRERRA